MAAKRKNGFRSTFESDFADNCKARGMEFEYETEQFFWTLPPLPYTPDFIFEKKDGTKMYIETKGVLSVADRRKMKAVKEQYPELDIRFIFMRENNRIGKSKSSATYKEWASRLGYKVAEGTMPSSWKKELVGHGNIKKVA